MNQDFIVGVIQARLGSTRLPNKMLLCLHGRPIIEWVVRRTSASRLLDSMIVAIPDTPQNDILEAELKRLRVECFRGPEQDVLRRFVLAAEGKRATHVVRICADNPLICGDEIDNLILFYRDNPCDYAFNQSPIGNSYPDGLGAEIVSFELLKQLDRLATLPRHREHCLSYIADHPGDFVMKTFDPPEPRVANPGIKLDIDTFEDYRKLALKAFNLEATALELVDIFGGQK